MNRRNVVYANNILLKTIYEKALTIYIFDSDLVWQMRLIIFEGSNSCCVCMVFLTLNAYY